MNTTADTDKNEESPRPADTTLREKKSDLRLWVGSIAGLGLITVVVIVGPKIVAPSVATVASAVAPSVTVSPPIQRKLAIRLEFQGQFSAVQDVELRAQVGGTLTEIGFKDGDLVQKDDLLFQIDPTPYQIKLSSAAAQLESVRARLDLAQREFVRADALKKTGDGSVEIADQRGSEQRAAEAAVDAAQAAVRDAQFDLDRTRITAPFTGRIGTHLVSVGNLISGSRAGTSPTTLLATIVSTNSIYLNFDMSEADYMQFLRNRQKQGGLIAEKVEVSLADEKDFTHQGTMDFIDNGLNRASGTIHARATVPNSDLLLTPGGFARVRVDIASPTPVLLVPDTSVLPDQAEHIVLTVGPDNVVRPKRVQIGDLREGLKVIRSGLDPSDRVIVEGIPIARPGATVSPRLAQKPLAINASEG